MIRKKTAKLLEGCAMIGAVIGGADDKEIETVRKFAEYTGLAFQIQDDLLDITANETAFGKRIGGDVTEGKKTFLLVKAFNEIKDPKDRKEILKIWNKEIVHPGSFGKDIDNRVFIESIKYIYLKYGIIDSAINEVERYSMLANERIERLKSDGGKELLLWFSNMLLNRKH
jgi:geranylgeranyl diphosphate synthase type II